MADSTMIDIVARCHCGDFDVTLQIPAASLPLKSATCHCNSCRHVTGQIFVTHVVIPLPQPPEDVSKLQEYATSKALIRYFCPKCGATVLNIEPDEWEFAAAAIRSIAGEGSEGKLNRVQVFLEDTKDGGAGIWLNGGTDQELPDERHYKHRDSELVDNDALTEMAQKSRAKDGEGGTEISGRCHCGAVKFILTRDDPSQKYKAGLCACYSCSASAGFEVTTWFTCPDEAMKEPNGEPFNLTNSAMTKYHTTPGMDRYFCNTCGAKVLCKFEKETTDVVAGLFEGSEGRRTEDWLVWTKYPAGVQYPEDAVDKSFVELLTQGVMKDRDGLNL